MAILEKVMQLKNQGVPENDIIEFLKEEGVSPKEINEAISQSKIKSELNKNKDIFYKEPATESVFPETGYAPSDFRPETQGGEQSSESEMQPSIMAGVEKQDIHQTKIPSSYQPYSQPYQDYQREAGQESGQQYHDYYQQPQAFSSENYYPEYQLQQFSDIETIRDIAEQLIEEKIQNMQKKLSSLSSFKEDFSSEIEILKQRIQRMENMTDTMQIAILKKIGQYGEDIHNIAKEMHVTQNSFSKIVEPLTDNIRELQKITKTDNPHEPKQESKQEPKSRLKKKRADFEDYLR